MDVGELFHLERALECERIVEPAPEIEEVAIVTERPREGVDGLLGAERGLDEPRQLEQLRQVALTASGDAEPRRRPRWSASRSRALTVAVKVLVDATLISGPAWT